MSADDELLVVYYKTDNNAVTFQWRDTSWIMWLLGHSPATAININFCPKGSKTWTTLKSASVDIFAQRCQLRSNGTYEFYAKAYKASAFEGNKGNQVAAIELKLY